MPKHIKISKHPDSRKFYVSDVCEFLSVEVDDDVCVCRTLNMTLWVGSIWNNLTFLSYMCTHTSHTLHTGTGDLLPT